MLKRSGALISAALIALAVGCAAPAPTSQIGAARATEPASSSAVASLAAPTAKTISTSPVDQGPQINWDAPLGDGKLTSAGAAAKDGALPFAPRTPQFSIAPITVQVSDVATTQPADRAVAYVYKFPLGADFLTDGRVRVLEYATTSTEAELEGVAKNPPGPPEDFAVVTIAGHSALLVQANGIGRIQYIQNGIMYDITGPAAPTAVVEKLAAQL